MGRRKLNIPRQRLNTTLPLEMFDKINIYLSNNPQIKSASELIEKALNSYIQLLPNYKKLKINQILRDLSNRQTRPEVAFIYWLDCFPELQNKEKLAEFFPKFYKEYLRYYNQQLENGTAAKCFIIEDNWRNRPMVDFSGEELKQVIKDKITEYNGIIEKIEGNVYFLFKTPVDREEVFQFLDHITTQKGKLHKVSGNEFEPLSLHPYYFGITAKKN